MLCMGNNLLIEKERNEIKQKVPNEGACSHHRVGLLEVR